MVEMPIMGNNTLDLILTNNPSTTLQVKVVPGISDHDCPLIDLNVRPIRYRQKPRKILYKKARWDRFEAELQIRTADKIQLNENTITANEI